MCSIRILVLIPAFWPLIGGAETNVLETAKRFVKNGSAVTVLTQSVKGSPHHEELGKIEIMRCKGIGSTQNSLLVHFTVFLSMLLEAHRNVAKRKPDVIHAHMAHYPLLVGITLKALTGKKLFVTVHGSDLNVYGKKFPLRPIIAWALKRADKVIVVSKELGDFARELGVPDKKVIHISNGVDTKFFHPKTSSSTDFDVLFFGGIKWMKGLDYLVEAVKTSKADGLAVKVAIAGEGPYLPQLINKVQSEKLEDNVVLLGKLDIYRLRKAIWRSKIIVFPSISEGLPCSLLEAMACAKPVIATNIGGISAVLKSGVSGVLIPPKDSKAIAQSIACLLRDQEMRERLSEKARDLVVEERNWDKVAEEIFDAYFDVLGH